MRRKIDALVGEILLLTNNIQLLRTDINRLTQAINASAVSGAIPPSDTVDKTTGPPVENKRKSRKKKEPTRS